MPARVPAHLRLPRDTTREGVHCHPPRRDLPVKPRPPFSTATHRLPVNTHSSCMSTRTAQDRNTPRLHVPGMPARAHTTPDRVPPCQILPVTSKRTRNSAQQPTSRNIFSWPGRADGPLENARGVYLHVGL
ncbi:hypothetical protein T484DRAFT_1941025 [Baffinella frigidus]|nr:hypothetical protein T484DRAFT_1941025 [Cryptophyta sp. CCMP2293]